MSAYHPIKRLLHDHVFIVITIVTTLVIGSVHELRLSVLPLAVWLN